MKIAVVLALSFALTGCATLLNQGVIEPSDVVAACLDIKSLCKNPAAAADPNVKQFCDVFLPGCEAVTIPTE